MNYKKILIYMKKNSRGSVSVMLILFILPMFLLAGVVVDESRIAASKSIIIGAGDQAIGGVLSEYDTILKEVYGLFVAAKSEEEMARIFKQYLQGSVPHSDSVLNEGIGSNFVENRSKFMNMDVGSVSISGVKKTELTNANVMKRQILNYLKYRGLASITGGILEKFKIFSQVEQQNNTILQKIEYDESLKEYEEKLETAVLSLNSYAGAGNGWDIAQVKENTNNHLEIIKIKLELVGVLLWIDDLDTEQGEILWNGVKNEFKAIYEGDLDQKYMQIADNICNSIVLELTAVKEEAVIKIEKLNNVTASTEGLLEQKNNILDKGVGYEYELSKLQNKDLQQSIGSSTSLNDDISLFENIKMINDVVSSHKDFFSFLSKELDELHIFNVKLQEITPKKLKASLGGVENINEIIKRREKLQATLRDKLTIKNWAQVELLTVNEEMYGLLSLGYSGEETSNENEANAKHNKNLLKEIASKKITKLEPESNKEKIVSKELPSNFIIGKQDNELITGDVEEQVNNITEDVIDKELGTIQKNILKDISKVFTNIGTIPTNIYEKLCLLEYMTEMFSNKTTNVGTEEVENTLSGVPKTKEQNHFYQNELEYILWGNDNLEKNLSYTEYLLFGTRFALNSAYVYSSSEMQYITLSMATAIAGWTVLGVPFIQNILLLTFALAESKIDLEQLLLGKAVPLYKTRTTWTLSADGLVRYAQDKIINYTESTVNDIFTKIQQLTATKHEELFAEIDKFVENTVTNVSIGASDALMNNLTNVISQIATGEKYKNPLEKVQAVKNNLEQLRVQISNGSEGTKNAKLEGLKVLMDNSDFLSELNGVFVEIENLDRNEHIEVLNRWLQNSFRQIFADIEVVIHEKLAEIGSTSKDKMKNIISEGKELTKDKLITEVKSFINNFSVSGVNKEFNSTSLNSLSLSTFSLTYKEYMKIFILSGLLSEEKEMKMLERVSHMIQVNMTKGQSLTNGVKKFIKRDDFNLANYPTYLKSEAEVNIKRLFTRNIMQGSIWATQFTGIKYADISGY